MAKVDRRRGSSAKSFFAGEIERCHSFTIRCLRETLSGLRDGLSLFSGPSRAAIIFALKDDDDLQIYDPQNLLRGHEPKLQAVYDEGRQWCKPFDGTYFRNNLNYIEPQDTLRLDGLLCSGGRVCIWSCRESCELRKHQSCSEFLLRHMLLHRQRRSRGRASEAHKSRNEHCSGTHGGGWKEEAEG